jgi:hypothetical protein
VPVDGASPGVGIKLFHRPAPNNSLLHFFFFSFLVPFSVHPLPREFLPIDTPLEAAKVGSQWSPQLLVTILPSLPLQTRPPNCQSPILFFFRPPRSISPPPPNQLLRASSHFVLIAALHLTSLSASPASLWRAICDFLHLYFFFLAYAHTCCSLAGHRISTFPDLFFWAWKVESLLGARWLLCLDF